MASPFDDHDTILRFSRVQRLHHLIMMICFCGLVVTGFPQKYSYTGWAWGVTLAFGGVERMRWLHHFLGSVMTFQLVWHLLELLWVHYVRGRPATMVPGLQDVHDFVRQVGYNLHLTDRPPRMGRYTFAEKLEYLALIWGSVIMVATGAVLLFPIHFAAFLPGQFIPAAKAAHGGEALLALLAVVTWHFYHVHLACWNPSIFSGRLPRRVYLEEHPRELEERLRPRVREAGRSPRRRVYAFLAVASLTVLAVVLVLDWMWTGSLVR